jgi:regulator of RNase E activity RraB
MPLSLLVVLGLFGIYLLVRGNQRARVSGDPDVETLEELVRAGSDLAEPHEIEFFLYVETSAQAAELAAELRIEGFTTEIRRTETEQCWLCLATRVMRPGLAELRQWRARFTALAEATGGAYDGWGTTVVEGERRA